MQDFTIDAGDDKTLEVDVKDNDQVVVDITAATIEWRASRNLKVTAALTKTTASGISITNASGGIFQITLDDGDTEGLVGNYYHEAQVTFTNGKIATILRGIMTVNPVLITA